MALQNFIFKTLTTILLYVYFASKRKKKWYKHNMRIISNKNWKRRIQDMSYQQKQIVKDLRHEKRNEFEFNRTFNSYPFTYHNKDRMYPR